MARFQPTLALKPQVNLTGWGLTSPQKTATTPNCGAALWTAENCFVNQEFGS